MKNKIEWLNDTREYSEIESAIFYEIDKGACKTDIVNSLMEDSKRNDYRGKFTIEQIENSIEKMLKDKLLVEPEEDWVQVSAWSRDGLEQAFKKDFVSCLKILKKAGVFHHDMITYDVVKPEDAPKWYRNKNKT